MTIDKYELIRNEMADDAYKDCIEVANRFAKAIGKYYARHSNDMCSWSEFHACETSVDGRLMSLKVRLPKHTAIELDFTGIDDSIAYDMGGQLECKWNEGCERINKETDRLFENADPDYYDYLDDKVDGMWKELVDECAKCIDDLIDAAECAPWDCYDDEDLDELYGELAS